MRAGTRRLLGFLRTSAIVLLAVILAGAGLLALKILSRRPLGTTPGTTHAAMGRASCISCHAPIADEWRQSFHFKSLTGPYWTDVRELGYLKIFEAVRKPCLGCHAPANVLDLAASPDRAWGAASPGVECTPNLFRDPAGVIPEARSDAVELGVDCTSCHVSTRGVVGTGLRQSAVHDTIADARFQDAAFASDTICRTCHGATVTAWKASAFPAKGVTCLDCHMPVVAAPSVPGGPQRKRRSHRFPGDKDRAMLASAINASLTVQGSLARFELDNDRVGHALPSGGNWLSLRFRAYDPSGRIRAERFETFGKEEALILDFWPFNRDTRIAPGGRREMQFQLPRGSGTVEVEVRYHDWMGAKSPFMTLRRQY